MTCYFFSVPAFLILVGHSDSDDLPETELFHPSLKAICENQREIEELAKKDCFISTGYVIDPQDLSFNKKQKTAIKNWIYDSL